MAFNAAVVEMNKLEEAFTKAKKEVPYNDPNLDKILGGLLKTYQDLGERDDSDVIQERLSDFYDAFQQHFQTVAIQKQLAEKRKQRERSVSS